MLFRSRAALLGDYLDNFNNTYRERMAEEENVSTDSLKQLGLKLLINLLFYSGSKGHQRLWLALLGKVS